MSQKLNVCMFIDAWFPFIGGGQIHVKNLIKHLETNYPVKVYLYHAPHHNIFVRAIWCFWVIPQVFFSKKFDLIHAHAFAAGIPAKILSLLLRIPVIYTVHGSHLMDLKKPGLKTILECWLLTGIRYDQQISVTKSFLKYKNVNKITHIPNGVDTKTFNQSHPTKHPRFTFLCVSRDHPTKGLNILRQAFLTVQKQYPEINLKLLTNIKPAHLVSEYKRAHAFVLPSLVEGQPLVLLEAWAAKLPVIATKTTGVSEITTKENALLIQPGSLSQLTSAMINMFNMKPKSRQKLGEAGYKLVKTHYTWEKVAHKTWLVYDQVYRHRFN